MANAGWDREAYLAQRRAARASGAVSSASPRRQAGVVARRPGLLARFGRRFNAVMDPLASMTMYSSDPQLARTSMIYTAQRELQKFKESQADQQALTLAQREEDLAHEEQRMRVLGRVMADEMVRRVEEQRRRGGR
jgi:hypothetical protein